MASADVPVIPGGAQHPYLRDLFQYPLMSALTERRTRRLARGTSLQAGPLTHNSANKAEPLSELEEAILITCITGVTGVTTHDGPLTKANGTNELGTPFLHIMARTGSSADNCQATHFFMINDRGIFLLKHPTGKKALELLSSLPPRWADWSDEDWLAAARSCTVRVSDRRLDFAREWPYYLGWNAQMSNVPGTTLFFPVVDCTWQYINALLILAAEPDGKRPVFIDDWRTFQPSGPVEWLAKMAGGLGLVDKIPYHPIGGLKWLRNGFVNKDSPAPLGWANTLRTDYEAFFYFQNLMLLGQAMGLGGWIHGSVFPPYIFHDDAAKGWHGLGFRFQQPKTLSPMAPVPASQPNPVGIDGILEGLCPPYVTMNEAVDRVIESKYGVSGGAYGDEDVFSRPYRNRDDAREYLKKGTRYGPKQVEYVKEACNYLFDTYGRFPAHVDAFYTPGMWLQFSHLELEYYDRFFDPDLYRRQAAHDHLWHKR
ncbi:MAG: hypothetical protein ACHQSE_01075 [Gemmatimonadales bacterium]